MGASQEVERFPKNRVTKSYVEREQKQRLAAGAILCNVEETDKDWVMTTVWPSF